MARECNGLIGDIGKKHTGNRRHFVSEETLDKLKHIAGPLALLTALMIYTILGGLVL